jgi:CHAD domain-containing protein
MSFRLKNGEKVGKGMRRMALEQADKALKELSAKTGSRDEAIHEVRVCFKKIRAILRLMRDRMGGDFREENAFFRDMGKKLSAVRNNVAMIETLTKLKEQFGGQLSSKALSGPRRPLVRSNAQGQGEKTKALVDVGRALRSHRQGIEKWPLGHDGFGDLADGLKRTYKQGRNLFAIACKQPTVENLHEWRKRVKDLWYQTRMLKKMWPGEVGKLADELKKLGDLLSDHHDLALLRESSAENWKEIGDETEIGTLIALIDQRSAELRLDARLLGERVYAENSGAFVHRMQCYWRAWRDRLKSQPIASHASKPILAAPNHNTGSNCAL